MKIDPERMGITSWLWLISTLSICSCLPPHRRSDSHLDDNKIEDNANENGYSMVCRVINISKRPKNSYINS